MHAIHWVQTDKVRPAVILTRRVAVSYLSRIVVAPIGTKVYGISTEVPVGPRHGLHHESVIKADWITGVPPSAIGAFIGMLDEADERALVEAIHAAFDLT